MQRVFKYLQADSNSKGKVRRRSEKATEGSCSTATLRRDHLRPSLLPEPRDCVRSLIREHACLMGISC